METADRAAVRARALELIRNPKPPRRCIALLAFMAGVACALFASSVL